MPDVAVGSPRTDFVEILRWDRPGGSRNRQLVVPQVVTTFDKESILAKEVPHAENPGLGILKSLDQHTLDSILRPEALRRG